MTQKERYPLRKPLKRYMINTLGHEVLLEKWRHSCVKNNELTATKHNNKQIS